MRLIKICFSMAWGLVQEPPTGISLALWAAGPLLLVHAMLPPLH